MEQTFVSIPAPLSIEKHGRRGLATETCRKSKPRHWMSSNSETDYAISRRSLLKGVAAMALAGQVTSPNPAFAELEKKLLTRRETDFLYDAKSGSFVPPSAIDALLRRDAGARFDRCIVAAEIHDNQKTHDAQLAIIDSARRLNDGKDVMVGFEQFYRGHNGLLNRYVGGDISLESLLKLTEWEKTWGYEAHLYIPIFEYCRQHGIPMRGLNVPQQFVWQVSATGLNGLPDPLKKFLPTDMDFSNNDHFEHFVNMIQQGHGVVDKSKVNRYYEVQVLWEEWMSESVASYLKLNPNSRMVTLVGSGHVEGRYGIPDRVERRCNERPYTIVPRPVAWSHDDGVSMPDIAHPEKNVADLIWYTRRNIDLV